MSLLQELVKEMASTGTTSAGSIASTRGSLFKGGIVDPDENKKKQRKMLRRRLYMKPVDESLNVNLGKSDFDASDVISKLDYAEKKVKSDRDTVPFGLEDENGKIIKVHVRSDQAEEFENALSSLLSGEDEDDDDKNTAVEIAEIIFQLKDKFDIVDVDWGEIEGDEQQEQEVSPEESQKQDQEGNDQEKEGEGQDEFDISGEGGEQGQEEPESGEEDKEMVDSDEDEAASALSQVIKMMQADAEAKAAEARAREAEAEAKQAKYAAQAAASKVSQEEQILDMEAAEDKKKKEDKEAKQLAKLARYQHQKANKASKAVGIAAAEQEESSDVDPGKLADLIFKHLKGQRNG